MGVFFFGGSIVAVPEIQKGRSDSQKRAARRLSTFLEVACRPAVMRKKIGYDSRDGGPYIDMMSNFL